MIFNDQHPPTHAIGDEAFTESGEVPFVLMFLGEQVSGIATLTLTLTYMLSDTSGFIS
jgi:pantothenate kinase-related protein Tda10